MSEINRLQSEVTKTINKGISDTNAWISADMPAVGPASSAFLNDVKNASITTFLAKTGLIRQNAGFVITDGEAENFNGGNIGKRLSIRYFSTDRSEKVSAGYKTVEILGRSSPIHKYSSGNAVAYTFTCWFVAEGPYGYASLSDMVLNAGLDVVANVAFIEREVMEPVRWLKSLVYPIEREGVVYAPPSPVFVFGSSFSAKVLITDVTANFFKTVESSGLYPTMAEVTINMIQNTNNTSAYSQSDIMKGNDTDFTKNKVSTDVIPPITGKVGTFLSMAGLQ